MRYPFIDAHRDQFSVTALCRVLKVSTSGYYAWRGRDPASNESDDQLLEQVQAVFAENHGRYGSPRIHRRLRQQGIRCGQKRVARLMREHGLQARGPRRRTVTTDSAHRLPVAENVLDRQFEVEVPNAKWAADITYIWTSQGWLYLAVVLDLFSRRIVGWSMQQTLERSLVIGALQMALGRRRPRPGLLLHSDRGSQYASGEYQQVLKQSGCTCSMSRKGNCWDNAPVESFFSTLKMELVHAEQFETRAQARRAVFEFIEVWYNRQRLHSSLGYLSPVDFEATQRVRLSSPMAA